MTVTLWPNSELRARAGAVMFYECASRARVVILWVALMVGWGLASAQDQGADGQPAGGAGAGAGAANPTASTAPAVTAGAADEQILPGVSGADFIGPDWEAGEKHPGRMAWFASAELSFDDNISVTGQAAKQKESVIFTPVIGFTYATDRNDGQQKYSLGAQAKYKAYSERFSDFSDFEAFLSGKAVLESYRWDYEFSERLARQFEPNDAVDQRAPRLTNTVTPLLVRLHAADTDISVSVSHFLRQEEKSQLQNQLEYSKLTYRFEVSRQIRPNFGLSFFYDQGETEYDDSSQSPSAFTQQNIALTATGRMPESGIRYNLSLGVFILDDFVNVRLFALDGTTPIETDTTDLYVNGRASWSSPDNATRISLNVSRGGSPVPSTTGANFEVRLNVGLQATRRVSNQVSVDASVSFEDVDRGGVGGPERLVFGAGAVWRFQPRRQAYFKIESTDKNDDVNPANAYDRLVVSIGLNLTL